MPPMIDLTGQRFGRLTVIRKDGRKGTHTLWTCKCDCGNITHSDGYQLRNGEAQSCGCYRDELVSERSKTHGMSQSKIYKVFCRMMRACYDERHEHYEYYGGRGITVCEEWRNDKTKFFQWAFENGYRDDLTIDRIDCNGNYEPSNCRWIPFEQQARNRRNTYIFIIDGKDYSITELSELTGIPRGTLYSRIHKYNYIFTDSEIVRFGFKNITQKEREARIWRKTV